MKRVYMIISHPFGSEPKVHKDEFYSVNDAVRCAIDLTCSSDFIIVSPVFWEAGEIK